MISYIGRKRNCSVFCWFQCHLLLPDAMNIMEPKNLDCNFAGQRERNSFIVLGQLDNRTSLNLATGRDGLGQPVKTGRDNHHFFLFRTSFPVWEHSFLFLNVLSSFSTSFFCFRMSFSCFLWKWLFPGTFRDRGLCPGIFSRALSRDKGTTGQGNIFIAW